MTQHIEHCQNPIDHDCKVSFESFALQLMTMLLLTILQLFVPPLWDRNEQKVVAIAGLLSTLGDDDDDHI